MPSGADNLAFDSAPPESPHAGNLYAINRGTLVYRSQDGGATRNEVLDGGFNDLSAKQPILAHPSRGGTVYAGAKIGATHAIFKTEDGGETWVEILVSTSSGRFQGLAIDPNDPEAIYAVVSLGVYKSENGGLDWRQVLAQRSLRSAAVDPRDSAAVWVGTDRELLRSRDGGESWATVRLGAGDLPGLFRSACAVPGTSAARR